MSDRDLLRFGRFELDGATGGLRRDGDPIKLPPQPFKVLELIVRRGGAVVTREEIRAHVWADDTVVDFEQGLNFCIRRIREALGDTADAPRYIETLPRRGYRFVMPVRGPEPSRTARVTRLIVLPFKALRPDPETDFLSFGLPDAVSSALGGLQSLVVRSSVAAARFASEAVEPKRIGIEADVDVIVTGTVLRAGSEVRVATQLTEAESGTLLRSYACQASLEDLFQVQDDLARCIVASLSIPLTNAEERQLTCGTPPSTRGYSAFLRANQLSYDARQWGAARELYEQSVVDDPGYAPAWARLGRMRHVMGKYLPAGSREGFDQAEAAFQRALELNADLTLAHKLYAQLEVDLGRAPDAMARLVERARTADPELLAGLVTACRYCGLLDASLAAHARAIELDPKVRTSVVHTWFLQRDYARVASTPFADAPYISSLALAELGRPRSALPVIGDFIERNPTRLSEFVTAARALLEGDSAASIAAIGRIVQTDFRDPEALFYLARHLAHLGETAAALELLERVVAGGFSCHPAMAADPWLEGLRKKPAFVKLLKQAEGRHAEAKAKFETLGGREILGMMAKA
jgi:DNA-binding winged helix-turn-helix (wHTH) protein